jgi:TfoX/Sxy family transcriptional regulator of competence genes
MLEPAYIRRMIDNLCLDWPGVLSKRMFGTDAWFVQGNIFAIIYAVKNSVGLRFQNEQHYTKARKLKGAGDFDPGGTPMKHWVIMPQALCAKETELEVYLRQSYEEAAALPPKVLKTKGRPMG